jgi:hypothetical protein
MMNCSVSSEIFKLDYRGSGELIEADEAGVVPQEEAAKKQ